MHKEPGHCPHGIIGKAGGQAQGFSAFDGGLLKPEGKGVGLYFKRGLQALSVAADKVQPA
jgi:hypothetical protein